MFLFSFFTPSPFPKQTKPPKPQPKQRQNPTHDRLYFVAWCSNCYWEKLCILLNSTDYSVCRGQFPPNCPKLRRRRINAAERLGSLFPQLPKDQRHVERSDMWKRRRWISKFLHSPPFPPPWMDQVLSWILRNGLVDKDRPKDLKGMEKRNCVYKVCGKVE